jgi:Fusaric acid resistance protein-like
VTAIRWLGRHDPGFRALRRALRAAVVMPAMFAVGDVWIGNPTIATFAAFGSFAMLLLVDFPGPIAARAQAQVALAVAGSVLVCLGTLASRSAATAVAGMALVGFGVVFAGVVSSVIAGATTPLLLAFILPVSIPGPVSQIPDRLAGWDMAAAAALVAVTVLWPAPARDPVRTAAIAALEGMAERLRADVTFVLAGRPDSGIAGREAAVARADGAVSDVQAVFYATPYRPTGLSTAARTLVRLVDELKWLDGVVRQGSPPAPAPLPGTRVCTAKLAVADVLHRAAELLSAPTGSAEPLHAALAGLETALDDVEAGATRLLPDGGAPVDGDVVSALDPSFRVQELAFVAAQIAHNVDLAAAAERRSWFGQLLGRQPEGLQGRLASAQERAGSHVERHSVSLRNSVRASASLALAVLVINLTDVQHAFWVVFGTLAVLRTNALSTGQNVVRGLVGTTVGFAVGAVVISLVGTDTTLLWALLPVAVLFGGLAPAAISFAAGQAGFSIVLLILFNIIAPEGWRIGIVRVEDVALGSAVSLAVGLLFWPRGAAAALGEALADAYAAGAQYLAGAVRFGIGRCDAAVPAGPPPLAEAARAAAAARRLDDTFRAYLAERGSKPVPLAEVTSLVSGVVGLRLAGDAVVDLWQRDDGPGGDRDGARRRLSASADAVTGWYTRFAEGLAGRVGLPEPQADDALAPAALAETVAHDLRDGDGGATAAAVRMIWTGDHLDAARRLQAALAGPAGAVVQSHALG